MTTDESPTHLIGTTPSRAAGRPLAEQHPAATARMADLVRKLTSLADRYEATIQDDDQARATASRQRVALLRDTAEAGHRGIRSLAHSSPTPLDRDAAAADPTDALAVRRAAQVGRSQITSAVDARSREYPLVRRLAESAIVRQAQGILMERSGLSADEAFALMRAATGPRTLEAVADHVARRGELPLSGTSPERPRARRPRESGLTAGSWSGSPTSGGRGRDEAAEMSAAVLEAVVEHAGHGIALLGLDGIAFQANPAFCRMLGCSEDDLLAMTSSEYTHPDDVEHDEAQFAQMLTGDVDTYRAEKRYLRRDGGVVWCAITVSAVRRSGGGLLFAVKIVEDITEQRRLREQLQHQALHDHLTGLPNRRLFDDRLAHAQLLARRQEDGLAVIVLDLDGFKAVNDTFGHPVGDEVLVAVAATLSAACRDSDSVARVGGDEFAVLCEGPGAAQQVLATAERLRTALAVTLTLSSGAQVAVSASVGFAVADAADEDDALLRRADAAMYRGKGQELRGRGA